MNIRTTLRIGTPLLTVLVVLFIVTMLLFLSEIRRAYDRQKIAAQITENAFQLSLLSSQYQKYQGERPKTQWINVYESQARLLREGLPVFLQGERHLLFEEIVELSMSKKELFTELIRNTERGGSETVIRELGNQLSVKAQSITSIALHLAELSRAEATAIGNLFAVVAGVFGMLVLGMAVALTYMSARIAQSIRSLGEGTKIIARGNMAHRLNVVNSDDEIGEVAQLFNDMAAKLQESHSTLERTVQDRTREISTILGALDAVALVSMTDAKGDIIYANDRFVEVSKYAREELIGKNHRILKSGHQPQSLFNGLWNTISHGKVWRGEIKNRAKDGSYYWVDTSITPVLNEQGRPERYISVRFLVTEKKKMMQEMKKFQQAVASSTDGIIITDDQTQIVYVNTAWSRLTGYEPSEVLGKKASILKTEKTDKKVLQGVRDAIVNGQPFHSDEFVNKRKDGTEYNAELTMYPVCKEEEEEEEQVRFFAGIHRDITERKRSDRSKSEFISLASHQLRTPLSVMRLVLETLLKGIKGPLTSDQKRLVTGAGDYAKRMAETINTLLSVSLSDEGKINLSFTDVSLSHVLSGIRNDGEGELKDKKLTMLIECPKQLTLNTDQNLLTEIVSNLVTNAMRYTPEGGTINIRAIGRGSFVTIDVQDSGIGVARNDQGNIFNKFFRAKNAMEMSTDGTGLGLYLVRSFVTLLGGTVNMQSEENAGSTFTIVLPINPPPSR